MPFDHERLDVYRVALQYTAWAFQAAKRLSGLHRHARNQLLRASQSIPLNIAEGNGKRSGNDRRRFFEIARGSAMECASIQDVLQICDAISEADNESGKRLLNRIVSMLTKMTERTGGVGEEGARYDTTSSGYGDKDDCEPGDEE
jgi:four helix bundle protein